MSRGGRAKAFTFPYRKNPLKNAIFLKKSHREVEKDPRRCPRKRVPGRKATEGKARKKPPYTTPASGRGKKTGL
jgi:hypothetical protein